MTALVGWPFDEPPLTYGREDGIAWATRAGRFDASVNGYAQIPAEHPWATVTYYGDLDVDVHGGLTFGPGLGDEGAPDLETLGGWIGFDTMHWRDWWGEDELRAAGLDPDPDHLALMDQLYRIGPPEGREPRRSLTLGYVEDQARGLAAQVAAARTRYDDGDLWRFMSGGD